MLTLLTVLFQKTPREADPAPAIPAAPPIVVPESDPADVIATPAAIGEPGRRLALDPVYVQIEYEDADGVVTRRRITVRTLDIVGGHSYLRAICHERHAARSFRADRLRRVIDITGVEIAPLDFLAELESAGDPLPEAPSVPRPRSQPRPDPVTPYTTLRRAITPGLILLTASARSDDALHPREINVILRWCEDEAMDLRDAGLLQALPSDADFDRIDRTIRRLRPMADDLDPAFADCAGWGATRLLRLARALVACAQADGRVDATEAAIAETLMQAGSRTHGFGWQG